MIKPRDQIVYIPNHVVNLAIAIRQPIRVHGIDRDTDGSIASFSDVFLTHPDCEFGFVTSIKDGNAWCRFWTKVLGRVYLRTKSCSERASLENLMKITWCEGVSQKDIDEACEQYSIEIRRE